MSKHIQTFEEWSETPRGREACDLTPFKALPKKHEPFVLARIEQAYEDGCTAVQVTMQVEERLLSPPENGDTKEDAL